MNDTHTAGNDDEAPQDGDDRPDPVDRLAALDPADAPEVAEEYARKLAADLEEAGAPAADPVQLRADLGDTESATTADS